MSSLQGVSTTRILSVCVQTGLLLMSVFHLGISSVKADVRCYCNLPVCISTGYMCKSAQGTCVSEYFGYSGNLWRSRHACFELVRHRYKGEVDCSTDSNENGRSYPTRTCCREDMCNYVRYHLDSQHPMYRLNHSYMTGYFSNDDYFYRHGGSNNREVELQHHLWFKAAVIAVPIAGGFILVLLIIMAARMLKQDHKRQRQFNEFRRKRRLTTHILYTGEKRSLPKSITNAILNHELQQNCAGSNNNNLYKNVSIAVSTDTACTDTSRDKYFVFDV